MQAAGEGGVMTKAAAPPCHGKAEGGERGGAGATEFALTQDRDGAAAAARMGRWSQSPGLRVMSRSISR